MMGRNAERRMRATVRLLLEDWRFFGALALRMPLQADGGVRDIACDGTTLRYSPDWAVEAGPSDLRRCIARVVLACALKHHTRRHGRDYKRWQQASVMATEPIMARAGMPSGQALPPMPEGREEMSAEQAYEWLQDQPPPPGEGKYEGGQGEVQDAPSAQGDGDGKDEGRPPELRNAETRAAVAEEERKWDKAAHQAVALDKEPGSATQDISRQFSESHAPRQPWRDILREFVSAAARNDYSWARPNRRFIDGGLYMPSLDGQKMGRIVLAIDTSGSIDEQQLAEFWGEIRAIAEEMEPESVAIVQCDARVKSFEEFGCGTLPDRIDVQGGGGTRYEPVFERLEREPGERPACLIYFTDLYCHEQPAEPEYPVLWAASGSAMRCSMQGQRNFGLILHLDKAS